MPLTNAWDETAPADTDEARFYANELRTAKFDIRERAEVDHEWDDTTEGGKHKKVTLLEQGSDPTVGANELSVYAKVAAGKANLFVKDEDGNVLQITEGGILAPVETSSLTVTGLSSLAAATLTGLLTLGAHLKSSVSPFDILRSDDVVGARFTESSPTEQLLQVLTGGALRDVFNAKQIADRDWTAAGSGSAWANGVDIASSYFGPAVSNIVATGWYIRKGAAHLEQGGRVRWDPLEIGAGPTQFGIGYPVSFGGTPSATVQMVRSISGANANNLQIDLNDDGAAPSLNLNLAVSNPGTGGSDQWTGFDFHAVGPLP